MSDSTIGTNPTGETTATGVADPTTTQAIHPDPASSPAGKGKGKATAADDSMDIDEGDDDDEDDDEDDEEDDDDLDDVEEEDFKEIDPTAILDQDRPRRNRPKVDYSSTEAHAKAGLKPGEEEDED
ncbi:unnamed protein product [Rhizoctonia solani]|uniref:Histone chaperone domain-containing protein n=1 Tax=Rhizoctonia solani TaxID=456999 RepID=A0A8H3GMW3_9AGAM|nr:unnamed protein product [Rhizoctonia solani]